MHARIPIAALAATLALLLPSGQPRAAGSDRHLAIISIDGLGARELTEVPTCVREHSMLRRLMRRGAYASSVVSVLPTLTYPAHATLVTGLPPALHGIVGNTNPAGSWYLDRSGIAAPTLWDAAHDAGLTVAIVTWPSTYGANVDYLVPENLHAAADSQEILALASTPGLFAQLAAATAQPRLLPFSDREAGEPLDRMTGTFAAEVVRRYRPNLLLAHFLDYDHRQHFDGLHSAGACAALDRVDQRLRQIVHAYRDSGMLETTTFIVVSDHGFLPLRLMVNFAALLDAAGWPEISTGLALGEAFDINVAGGSVAFTAKAALGRERGDRLAAVLRARVQGEHGNLVRWMDAGEASFAGGFPGASFVLCARPGFSFVLLPPSGSVLVDPGVFRGMHGHCPDEPMMDAVFIASGHGVRAAGNIGPMDMEDVAPTIATLMGLSLPKATGRDVSPRFSRRP
jgi:predicted AlkP superfamily pyrophosphatase or phosphodiesterase